MIDKVKKQQDLKRNLNIKKMLDNVFDITTEDGKKLLTKKNAGITKHNKMLAEKKAQRGTRNEK
jgi:hypothetical protein